MVRLHLARIFGVMLAVLFVGAAGSFVKLRPYRWCAQYGGGKRGGGTNCYFVTLEQCRAAASGNGGFCVPNNFYDGRPVVTPEDSPRRKRR